MYFLKRSFKLVIIMAVPESTFDFSCSYIRKRSSAGVFESYKSETFSFPRDLEEIRKHEDRFKEKVFCNNNQFENEVTLIFTG